MEAKIWVEWVMLLALRHLSRITLFLLTNRMAIEFTLITCYSY